MYSKMCNNVVYSIVYAAFCLGFLLHLQVHLQTQQEVKMRMTSMATQVVRSDGLLALYNGLSASLCRQVSASEEDLDVFELNLWSFNKAAWMIQILLTVWGCVYFSRWLTQWPALPFMKRWETRSPVETRGPCPSTRRSYWLLLEVKRRLFLL